MILAPMEDVTDTAFRELVMQLSAPNQLHVVYTEFTSTDGLCHPAGRPRVEYRLKITESERHLLQSKGIKIVAQIWGNKPEKFEQAIRYIEEAYTFDGIDINMGCPVKNVIAHGSCSALIANESLAADIISATREASKLPVSVKTRIGIKESDTERWIGFLLQQPLDAITIHGRTQKQMSQGMANWEEIRKAVSLRNDMDPHISIIGNGDVESVHEASEKMEKYGVDGIMIGRGIFKNPWLFDPGITEPTAKLRCQTLLNHLDLYDRAWGHTRHYAILKRFFKIYITGFQGASDIRDRLMHTSDTEEARRIISQCI